MIISPETFYNISAVLHIALLVWITVLIFSSVIVALAKVRALRDLKSVKAKMEAMINEVEHEDPHTHMETHAHVAGEAIAKDDLVVARNGVLVKADANKYEERPHHFSGFSRPVGVSVEEVDLSKAPKEVQDMVAEMRGNGFKGDVQAIRVKLPKPQTAVKRKRTAVKKVAKKIIKKKNK